MLKANTSSQARRSELDAVRGLMLVWMALTHLPTRLPAHVNQPFGFISATEGFIFLSALFTGCIFFRLAEREGYGAMRRKLWTRSLRLYMYHGLLLAFAFLIAVPVAAHGDRPGLHNLLNFYFTAGAHRAVADAALLIYRPPLLDILPMYIIFLVATPGAMIMTRRMSWKHLISGSFLLWLLAQFGLRQAVHDFASFHFGMAVPVSEMGAFDLWAWQLMWILGLWFGVRWAKGDLPVESWCKRATLPAAIIFGALFAFRYTSSNMNLDFGSLQHLFDKWHFGPIRLVNFASAAVLLIRFQATLKPLAVRPLVILGQASLQVFCVHLVFCFAGLTIMGPNAMLSDWRQYALLTATLAAMFVTAIMFSKSNHEGKLLMLPSALEWNRALIPEETLHPRRLKLAAGS
jgi:hypothetical protein